MLYSFFQLWLPRLFQICFGCERQGVENIPREGGLILAANHISNWDPPVAAAFVPRKVHYMAKEELFRVPLFSQAIRALGAFPVRRGASDRAAIRKAINLLADGACLGVFPEGTRSRTGQLGKAEPGLALLAVKSGAPVVPTAIVGTNRIFSKSCFFPRVKIRYGKPLAFTADRADRAAMQAFSDQVMAEIEKLLQDAQK